MGVAVIIFLLVLLLFVIFLLFKILKWIFRSKRRLQWTGILLFTLISSFTIYRLFFNEMKFIQSKVYSDLYIIKNPVQDRDSLFKLINEKVFVEMNNQIQHQTVTARETPVLRFYEHYTGDWGEQGTVYFIENEEKIDGMSSELLEFYHNHLRAEYHVFSCDKDSANTYGLLSYYQKRRKIKTDTIFNNCSKKRSL